MQLSLSGILKITRLLSAVFVLMLLTASIASAQQSDGREQRLEQRAENRLQDTQDLQDLFEGWHHTGRFNIDSIRVDRHNQLIKLHFNPHITHIPIRFQWIKSIENQLKNMLGWRFRNYSLEIYAADKSIFEFIPNLYRTEYLDSDSTRIRISEPSPPLVQRLSKPDFTAGLAGNHIALWHSHGYYYNGAKDRWEWQRARLFGTVEDIFPMEYVLKYIAPMLENAGANTLIPRERDLQLNEIIVDNDISHGSSGLVFTNGEQSWESHPGGFMMQDTLRDGENPFRKGSHLRISANSGASLTYIPEIPENGYYAVYISWAAATDNVEDVNCVLNYAGGSASFSLNQKMGAGTWIYLGHFYFTRGKDADTGSLELFTHSRSQGTITADAVRFGGGMGTVARRAPESVIPNQQSASDRGISMVESTDTASSFTENTWKISQRPRYMEGARYFLQYAGMPDTLVYSFNEGKNDYNDDFMSRGEWINYLTGGPLGPERDRTLKGLGIPVDLSFSFHTDAGITPNDSVIGTLAIYSAQRDQGKFPDGVSRMASRDLTDIVQDQIVNDIRATFNPQWTRRALWDRQYSEAWRPNVPAMLLELLSHQNLEDMKYGLDPRFQFTVSRAIYKGILRFVAHQEGRDPIVQPLPPVKPAVRITEGKNIRISWQGQDDLLEPTASPEAFIVYTRQGTDGFDQGVQTEYNFLEMELPQYNTLYSFKITAINKGGESFPSGIISVAAVPGNEKAVLIVNAYDRLSGPGTFEEGNKAGITWWDDHPVPYGYSAVFTGFQYDYDRNSPWLDDDSPGWGASFADDEGKVIQGNTFDYARIHGESILRAGRSFVTASRAAFEDDNFSLEDYNTISLITGKQKGISSLLYPDSIEFRVFTSDLTQKLEIFTQMGGNIFISGAYIGTDMVIYQDEAATEFAKTILGYTWRTNNASRCGQAKLTDAGALILPKNITFNNAYHTEYYTVEAPDAIEPAGEKSFTVLRYSSNNTSAATLKISDYRVFALGFPFESITSTSQRDELMRNILQFFESHKTKENDKK